MNPLALAVRGVVRAVAFVVAVAVVAVLVTAAPGLLVVVLGVVVAGPLVERWAEASARARGEAVD